MINHTLRNGKEGRAGGAHRTAPSRFLLVVLTITLLIPVQSISAADQITSGTTQLSNTTQFGNTAYAVDYSYLSTAEVGKNLTIDVSLHVRSLTGLVEYLFDYGLIAKVYIGTQFISANVSSEEGSHFLYPGATWGPKTIIIPLTPENTGLSKGQSANATMSLTLTDTLYIGGKELAVYLTEPAMQGAAGSFEIQNGVASTSTSSTGQGTAQTYLPYVLLASGAVLVLLLVFLPRGPRSPQANQK